MLTSCSTIDPHPSPGLIWPGLFVLALSLFIFAPTLRFGFVYDDEPQIRDNHFLAQASFSEAVSSPVWFGVPGFDHTNRYVRPVFSAFLWVGKQIFKNDAWKWHAAAILLHGTITFLVLLCLYPLLGKTAIWAAAFFAVHPSHVESVAWISGVTDPLCALFLLPGLLAYQRWYRTERTWCLIACMFCFAGALLAKDTAIAFPAWLFCSGLWASDNQAKRRAWWLAFGSSCGVVLLWIAWRSVAFGGLGPKPGPTAFPEVVWTGLSYASFYLRHLFWPTALAPVYSSKPVSFLDLHLLVQAALWSGLLACLLWFGRKYLHMRWLGWWSVVFILLPYSYPSLFEVDDALHDRYLYLASFGSCGLWGLLVAQMPGRTRIALGTALVCIFGLQNLQYQNSYATNLALFSKAVESYPASLKFNFFLGAELLNQGHKQEAERIFKKILSQNPNHAKSLAALGSLAFEKGNAKLAFELQRQAASLQPGYARVWKELGDTLSALQQKHEAIQAYIQAVELDPSMHQARWKGIAEALLQNPPRLDAAQWFLEYMLEEKLLVGKDRQRYLQLLEILKKKGKPTHES